MDDELRKHFADLMSSMEGVASDARAAASTSRETASVVRKLDGRVTVLEKHVFGSDPPPPPPARPMAESIGEHDGDIAEVRGELIAVRAELEKQSSKMNIDAKGFWAFVHNTKLQDVAKLVTLLAAAVAAWKGLK